MNPQQKKQIIILSVLILALVGVFFYMFVLGGASPPKRPPTKSPTPTGAASGTAKPAATSTTKPAAKPVVAGAEKSDATELKTTDIDIDQLLANVKEVDFDYDRERVPRDPMLKLIGKTFGAAEEKQENTESLRNPTVIAYMKKVVSGIMWDEQKPLAIVDNEVVGAGYQYPDGGVVKSITRDQVVFQVGDSLIEVPLKEL